MAPLRVKRRVLLRLGLAVEAPRANLLTSFEEKPGEDPLPAVRRTVLDRVPADWRVRDQLVTRSPVPPERLRLAQGPLHFARVLVGDDGGLGHGGGLLLEEELTPVGSAGQEVPSLRLSRRALPDVRHAAS